MADFFPVQVNPVLDLHAIFGRPENDAPDGKPVGQVFVLLVPEHATEQHLQLLSELAQMFSERRFREALAAADSPQAVHDVFATWQPQ